MSKPGVIISFANRSNEKVMYFSILRVAYEIIHSRDQKLPSTTMLKNYKFTLGLKCDCVFATFLNMTRPLQHR